MLPTINSVYNGLSFPFMISSTLFICLHKDAVEFTHIVASQSSYMVKMILLRVDDGFLLSAICDVVHEV